MRRLYRLLPAVILLTLYSCGDGAIFLAPVDEPAELWVETIAAGSILLPGSEVTFHIGRDPVFTGNAETADRLVVELFDSDGVLLGEQIYESVDQADELPSLVLPVLGEGLFVLRTSYMDGDEIVVTENVPFFISAGHYSILGISSFPATLYPRSAGLLTLNLAAPPGSDPYLEWYLDDELISAGQLSETGTSLEIRAPGETGAYTVRVDLFPSEPFLSDLVVPAVLSYVTELLVTTETVLDHSDLAPERNYFALYHLSGDLRDSGARTSLFESTPKAAREIGTPTLAVDADIFGYRFDGDDGFEFDGLILPVRDGVLTPFSLSFRLRSDEIADPAHLVTIEVANKELLQLDIDGEGHLDLALGDRSVVSSGKIAVEAGAVSVITVTVVPVEDVAFVQFYVDGESLLSETVELTANWIVLPDSVAENDDGWMALPGTTRLGGDGGFVGIIDEFGVYFRDSGDQPSADTEIFRSAMELVYGDKLVYAEGFDATDLPDTIKIDGEAEVETGRLILTSGASALFPVFGFSSEELFVTVSLEALPGSGVRFYRGDGDELIAELIGIEVESESGELEFQFTHSDSILIVSGPASDRVQIDLDSDEDFTGLRLEVVQTGLEPARIAVESVVAWRERPQIPALLLEPDQETARASAGSAGAERTDSPSTGDEATHNEPRADTAATAPASAR